MLKRNSPAYILFLAYFTTLLCQICELIYSYIFYQQFTLTQIGIFSWASAIFSFFNLTSDMGIESILLRKFKNKEISINIAIASTTIIRGSISILALALLITLNYISIISDYQGIILVLMGFQVVFNTTDAVCRAWLRANGEQNTANMLNLFLSILKVISIVIVVSLNEYSIVALLLFILAARAVASLAIFIVTRLISNRNEVELKSTESALSLVRSLLTAGLALGGIGALTAVQNRLDWLMVSHFVSAEGLSSYSLANKFYEVSQLIVGVSIATLFPWLCRPSPDSVADAIVVRVVLAGGVGMGMVGYFCAPLLVDLLFGNKFGNVEQTLQIMMVAVGFMAASGAFYNFAFSRGLERFLLVNAIVATCVQVAANAFLIPALGLAGAALGMVVLVTSTFFGQSFVLVKSGLLEWRAFFRTMLFLAFFPLTIYVSGFLVSPWLTAPFGTIVILLIAYGLLFSSEERRKLAKLVSSGFASPRLKKG